MARIRSIHPGLFTDEEFLCLSDAARVLLVGLWTEADDQGVFEWKPMTIKARLRPVNEDSVSDLLAELQEQRFVTRFDHAEKSYGAVRNFRKYQRPRKPNEIHPLPDEIRTYVGLSDPSTEPVPHQTGTDAGKPPQMEEEGGRRKDVNPLQAAEGKSHPGERETDRPALPPVDPVVEDARAILDAHRETVIEVYARSGWQPHREDMAVAKSLVRAGFSADRARPVIETMLRRLSDKSEPPPRSLAYFEQAIREADPATDINQVFDSLRNGGGETRVSSMAELAKTAATGRG